MKKKNSSSTLLDDPGVPPGGRISSSGSAALARAAGGKPLARRLRDGGPSDAEWEAYKQELNDVYAMESLLNVYQAAYDRYAQAEQ